MLLIALSSLRLVCTAVLFVLFEVKGTSVPPFAMFWIIMDLSRMRSRFCGLPRADSHVSVRGKIILT